MVAMSGDQDPVSRFSDSSLINVTMMTTVLSSWLTGHPRVGAIVSVLLRRPRVALLALVLLLLLVIGVILYFVLR